MAAARDWVSLAFPPQGTLLYVTDLPIRLSIPWETFEPASTNRSDVTPSRRPTFLESQNATRAGSGDFVRGVVITKHMSVMAILDMRTFITATGYAPG